MIYSYHEPERRDTVFKNKNGELRSGWKIAGMLGTVFGVLFLLMFLIQFGFVFIMTTTGNLDPTTAAATPLAFLTAAIINSSMMFLQTIVMITIPILLWTKVLKKDKASLGLPPLAKQRRTMRQGLAMGAGSMTLVFLLLIVTDSALVLTWIPQGSPSLLIMFFLYILIGYSEEIICRGYIQGVMRQTHNPGLIILVPSLIFSLLHSANQGIGWLPYLNLFLIGLFLSLITLSSGNLYSAIGFHIFWNFFQGPIYGFSVSGGQESGLLTTYMKGNSLLNGGTFGPEGGLIVTAVMLFMIGAWYWRTKEQLPEMIAMLKTEENSVAKPVFVNDDTKFRPSGMNTEEKANAESIHISQAETPIR